MNDAFKVFSDSLIEIDKQTKFDPSLKVIKKEFKFELNRINVCFLSQKQLLPFYQLYCQLFI